MKSRVKLIDFPVIWIPLDWKKSYDIFLLEVDNRCDALEGLFEIQIKDQKDFKCLLATLRMQLESNALLKSEKRLKKMSDNNKILEFKSSGGNSRLFGFIDKDDKKIIICTNTFWKTTGKKRKQSAAFKRAQYLMETYYARRKG